MSGDVYERLAQRLDALPNGYPRTESGIELKILRKIYNRESMRQADRQLHFHETFNGK